MIAEEPLREAPINQEVVIPATPAPHIFAITNQKGGVGKTTTAINLAASLAAINRRTLLIDLDPQGNATTGSGIDKYATTASICEVILGEVPAKSAIIKSEHAYDLLPANANLTIAEIKLLELPERELQLKKQLQPILDDYDFIVLDCAPSLNMLAVNALVAATGIIIPMQCEYYALEGLTDLLETIEQLKQTANPKLEIIGVLRTLYDPRSRLTKDVSDELRQHFGDKLFRNVIPRNVRLAEAPSYGKPIFHYAKRSSGAQAYLALASELVQRL